MQKDANIKALESEGASSKPTEYVQICLSCSLFLPSIRVLKFLEDEGTSVAPLKHTLRPISSAEAIPAIISVEAVPAVSPAEAILEDILPQGSSCATGGILRGHTAATYYSPADDKNIALNIIETTKLKNLHTKLGPTEPEPRQYGSIIQGNNQDEPKPWANS